jgi:MFS family permease
MIGLTGQGIGKVAENYGKGKEMAKQISDGRKFVYYLGLALMTIGGLLFASVFVTAAMHFGDPEGMMSFQDETQPKIFEKLGIEHGNIRWEDNSNSLRIHFGKPTGFNSMAQSMMFRAFGGIGLIVIGAILRGIGAQGLAGSGVVLNPEKAREDLEPYSRMAGGMVEDALQETSLHPGGLGGSGGSPAKVVMIKCPACGKLNEEDSKFCRECGQKL